MSFFGDLWDSFTGESQRRDIGKGRTQATAQLTGGRDAAVADDSAAEGYFAPFASGGAQYYKTGADLMGLNGPEAREAAQGVYLSDPIYQAMGDRALKGISRGVASSGQTGAGIQAGTNALYANYKDYLDRLTQGSQLGLAGASGAAGARMQAGATRFATGQQLAGVDMSAANAEAASRSTTLNNLLAIAGLGVQAYTGAKYPSSSLKAGV
jgi:hypothetical protein